MNQKLKIQSSRKAILLIGDGLFLSIALVATLLLRYGTAFSQGLLVSHIGPFSVLIVGLLVVFYIYNLYELTIGKGWSELFNKLGQSFLIGAAIGMIYFYLGTDRFFTIRPQRVLAIYLIVSAILILFWRLAFNRLARSPKISQQVLFIGASELTNELLPLIKKRPEFGMTVAGVMVENQAEIATLPGAFQLLAVVHDFTDLPNWCKSHGIQIIISAIHPRENSQLLRSLLTCIPLNIHFYDIATFYEKLAGKIPIGSINQLWLFENLSEGNKRGYDSAKRVADIIFSVLLLIVSLPFVPFISLAIKLTSTGPIFFVQTRVGKDGKNFTAIKFRTMVPDAEAHGPQWAQKNDPRVTSLGGFMRKTRIDEIPQLINVLRGEMSMIGPRPERPEFISNLATQIPFYQERLLIKPGITGWAQVMGPAYGGSTQETYEKLQYDLFYIKNRSFGLDASITLKTIRTVLMQRGH